MTSYKFYDAVADEHIIITAHNMMDAVKVIFKEYGAGYAENIGFIETVNNYSVFYAIDETAFKG